MNVRLDVLFGRTRYSRRVQLGVSMLLKGTLVQVKLNEECGSEIVLKVIKFMVVERGMLSRVDALAIAKPSKDEYENLEPGEADFAQSDLWRKVSG